MHIHNDKIANMMTLLYSDDDDNYLILYPFWKRCSSLPKQHIDDTYLSTIQTSNLYVYCVSKNDEVLGMLCCIW